VKYFLHLFRPWIYLTASLIATFMVVALIVTLMFSRKGLSMVGAATAVITVLPAPTATPTPTSTSFVTPTTILSELPTPVPGDIKIGALVQIVGTGGDGLRLRDEPGLGTTVLTTVSDTEVFKVLQGPSPADGYEWWYISDPYNDSRRGWAVANYLKLVNNP
jgi:hypothetical protein